MFLMKVKITKHLTTARSGSLRTTLDAEELIETRLKKDKSLQKAEAFVFVSFLNNSIEELEIESEPLPIIFIIVHFHYGSKLTKKIEFTSLSELHEEMKRRPLAAAPRQRRLLAATRLTCSVGWRRDVIAWGWGWWYVGEHVLKVFLCVC